MALETVFIIIISTAAIGHVARETSDIHYTRDTRAELVSQCIAETKEAYFASDDEIGESLEELIEDCYETDDN